MKPATPEEIEALAVQLAGEDGYRAAIWGAVDEAVRLYYRRYAREVIEAERAIS